MNHYCIWFVSPDDAATRRAEVTLDGTIHSHRVLEEIEARIAHDCGLSTILITHWQRFEEPPDPPSGGCPPCRVCEKMRLSLVPVSHHANS